MNEIIYKKLKEIKPILKEEFGIEEFAIFGSVAKENEREDSDIDIVIFKMRYNSGFDLIRARYYLEKILGRKVDIGTFRAMKTFIKRRIKNELVYI